MEDNKRTEAPIIFVVEDNRDLSLLIQDRLSSLGFSTESAGSGKEALAKVSHLRNSIILLDYMLPDMTAIEFIQELDRKNLNIPFLVMTGQGSEGAAVDIMKLGARDYIIKDLNIIEMLPHRIRAIFRDLKHEKELADAEIALMESEAKYRDLVETTSDWIWEVDKNTVYTYVSPKINDILGYEPEEILGKTPFDLMSPEEIERVKGVFGPIAAAQKPFKELENKNLHKDGHEVILETSGVPILDADGRFHGYRGIDRDVTDRKKDEERLKVSLREKDILIRELFHRTKNNMQVISSLLNLQSISIDDENVLNIFKETQNRIRSIALVHEKLYQSNDLSRIILGDYIQDMTRTLLMSYGMSEKISIEFDADTISTSIDTAIPCGLITNEIITNSMKYAFPDRNKGAITVAVKSAGEKVELRITDNGIGLPNDVDFSSVRSLGLKLVRQLTENQLHGKISCKSGEGVEFIITFRNEDISTIN